MRRDTLNQAVNYHRARSRKSKRNKLITVLAAIVVFCTTYALIMPAITLTTPQERLDCPLSIHEHTDDCYDSEGNLICGEADFVVHTHDGNCYDAENNLVCELPEIEEHEHDESCYYEVRSLICDLEESEGHQHTGDCYIQEQELICTDEDPEHEHTDDCYEWTEVLICGEEESGAGHIHTDECYEITRELICGEPAIVLHEHTDDCYDMGGNLICGQLEVLEHKHSAECFVPVEEDEEEPIIGEIIEEIEEELIEEIVTMPIDAVSDIMNAVAEINENEEGGANGEGESTEPEEPISHNLGDYITDVTLQKRPNEGFPWEGLTTDENGAYVVDVNDQLRFEIKYEIRLSGEEQLGDNSTFTYTLPEHLKPVAASTGDAVNANGDTVGQYQISTDGTICIVFSDTYAKMLSEGKAVTGFVRFEGSFDSTINQTGGTKLNFKDDLVVDFAITDEGQEKRDLTVKKEQSEPNLADGTVTYTITVWSENGTDDDVTLRDVMNNIGLDGTITVEYAPKDNWDWRKITPEYSQTQNGFEMSLPEMDAGDKYRITYTAKLPDDLRNSTATVSATNDVTVMSKNEQGRDLSATDHVDTTFQKFSISKRGQLEGDLIQWTITINNMGQRDLAGYTLWDDFNGSGLKQSDITNITINGMPVEDFEFPYTFPTGSTAEFYTIVYYTKAEKQLGTHQAKNKATLEKDDEKFETGDIGVDVDNEETFNPLTKKANSLTVNEDGKSATISWTIEIDASTQGISSVEWTLNDELWDYNGYTQRFTNDQYQRLEYAAKTAIEGAGFSEGDYTITQTRKEWAADNGLYINGFQIKFTKPLEQGTKFSFTFESTAWLGDGTTPLTFTNSSNLDNKVWSNPSIQYTPLVRKYDLLNGKNYNDSNHNYYDLTTDADGNRLLQWGITVTLPENYNGSDLTITETLPEGTALTYLDVKATELQVTLTNPKIGNCTWGNYTIQASQSGQTITITFPGNLITDKKLKEFTFTVETKIEDSTSWETEEQHEGSFNNSVTVDSADQKTHGSDQQTQVITKDDTKPVVQKSGTVNNNMVSYSIVVNPEGKILLDGESNLTLVDTLNYNRYTNTELTVSYVLNSLHVYHLDSDGKTGAELGIDEISYSYETQADKYSPTKEFKNILTIHLPDGQALLVEYQYKVSGSTAQTASITNTAVLEGHTESSGSQESSTVEIKDVHVEANANYVTIYKYDEDNFGLALEGAKFHVYQCDENRQYQPIKDDSGNPKVYTTNANGQVVVEDIIYNTAYKVVEVEAPSGYIKTDKVYEFYVASSDENQFLKNYPENFTGKDLNMGAVIEYPNKKATTEITVKKQWFNMAGDNITKNSGSITFKLYQIKKDGIVQLDDPTVTVIARSQYNPYDPNKHAIVGEESVASGSTVTIKFKANYDEFKGDIFVNDTKIPGINPVGNVGEDRYCWYEYQLVVSVDTTIIIDETDNKYTNVVCEIISTPPEEPSLDAPAGTLIDEYTISATDNWTKSISGLARFYVEGNDVHEYHYYVVETSSSVQTTATEYDNLGIASGTITIKNTIDETPSYVLPETGGTGTTLYTAGGLLLMGGAISLLLYHHAKGKKEDSAPA